METAMAVEKLLEVAESEVVIEFKPGTKCRSTLHLRSLHPSSAVAFKVQTSSPAKFHVNPPAGVLAPHASAALHVILRPQPHPPTAFPRSPSDRFLIKASLSSDRGDSATPSHSHDVKLKVAYVGPFLLRHAAALGDAAAVRHLLRRQPHLLPLLPPEAPATPAAAATPKGWTGVHAAAAAGEWEELRRMLEEEEEEAAVAEVVEARDAEGRTPVMVAAGKGHLRCVRELVEKWGAEKDARSRDGRTALYRAASNGDADTVAALLEMGADAGIATARGRTPLDVARDKGHQEVVELLERGEMVLTASRKGDLRRLECLLRKRVGVHSRDQYGLTALHAAAIKGHRDAVALLADFGMDLECQDVEGHTPLHLAVEGGCLETVETLIDMGANVNAKTNRGATPLVMARSMGYEAIAQLLATRGAVSSSCIASSSSSSTS
ncbi:protein VAPYRIN-like [Musa acuminata AAA Group]|uniref:protein VAPYRIN-like n=1 Tax=Musa acuminata AAA Group TaxID=214697 RepID=UPI0031DAD3D4